MPESSGDALPIPLRPLLPRAAAIVAWLCANQERLQAIENGQLVFDWGGPAIKARLTETASVPALTAPLRSD